MTSTTYRSSAEPTEQRGVEPTARERPLWAGAFAFLLPLQLFLIAGWLRAGVEKLIEPDWWSGELLLSFLEEQRPQMLPFFTPFADHVLTPLAPVVAWLVMVMQLAIAACLVTRKYAKPALWAGIVLNLCFTLAGRVNPSAFYLVMQVGLLFALSRPVPLRIALRRATLWLVPATLFAPFARTIAPEHVIEDPALMISFVSLLAAVTTLAISGQSARLVEMAGSTRLGGRVIQLTRLDQHPLMRELADEQETFRRSRSGNAQGERTMRHPINSTTGTRHRHR